MATTHYPDAPRLAVGVVVIYEQKVLLVLRGKPPGKGTWAMPGGSVELGETLKQAAEREVLEETGLSVTAGEICYTFETIQRDDQAQVVYHYVIIDLLAEPLDPTQPLHPADDVDDAAWFTRTQIDNTRLPMMRVTRQLLQQLLR